MAGPGSGMWIRSFTRPRCESYRQLDIRVWHRQRRLWVGSQFPWVWSTPEGAVVASIGVSVTAGGIRLTYRYQGREESWPEIDETIQLTITPQPYGGMRPWFRCPCGRRVAILYGAGVYFRCRYCYDLRYQTERETPPFRQLTKAQKIRERLGGQGNLREAFPPKPPKMRWDTY
jgi:hypothetical protein